MCIFLTATYTNTLFLPGFPLPSSRCVLSCVAVLWKPLPFPRPLASTATRRVAARPGLPAWPSPSANLVPSNSDRPSFLPSCPWCRKSLRQCGLFQWPRLLQDVSCTYINYKKHAPAASTRQESVGGTCLAIRSIAAGLLCPLEHLHLPGRSSYRPSFRDSTTRVGSKELDRLFASAFAIVQNQFENDVKLTPRLQLCSGRLPRGCDRRHEQRHLASSQPTD